MPRHDVLEARRHGRSGLSDGRDVHHIQSAQACDNGLLEVEWNHAGIGNGFSGVLQKTGRAIQARPVDTAEGLSYPKPRSA
ncbi:hypothetical protein BURCENBC7_AP4439 [Burkholderia cenocepacia BC7]|nr:hypothetical protein BURCENBC7_AP4439 [Burkholderia cenocepacia BC7]